MESVDNLAEDMRRMGIVANAVMDDSAIEKRGCLYDSGKVAEAMR
jgi:hypothetical protein